MTEPEVTPLFDPDPHFAAGWSVNEPLAQGALKHASVVVLDELEEARSDLVDVDPDLDLDDLPSLWLFPESIRPALTLQLVDQLHLAAVVVGWKLAQPGPPIPPGCIAEELALELIRQGADLALELEDAPRASFDATKGVYELCPHGNVADYLEALTPAGAALSSAYAVPSEEEEAAATSAWFQPFYPGQVGCAPHPVYLERPRPVRTQEPRVSVVEPSADAIPEKEATETIFRIFVRTWGDDFADREEFGQMPDHWLAHVQAPCPEAAWAAAVADEDLDLGRDDLARVTIEIQQAGLPQSFKLHGTPFHIVGSFAASELDRHLPRFAAHLSSIFPTALLAQDEEGTLFGVTAYAESHDEAEADFQDAFDDFVDRIGVECDFIDESSCGIGKLEARELLAEMKSQRRRRREWRQRSSSSD